MNIFFLDKNPTTAAEFHCDKHVPKMVLETAQILSTAHRVLDGVEVTRIVDRNGTPRKKRHWQLPDLREGTLLKATHLHHGSVKWAMGSMPNYVWTFQLFLGLLEQFEFRFGKRHAYDQENNSGLVAMLAATPDALKPKDDPTGDKYNERYLECSRPELLVDWDKIYLAMPAEYRLEGAGAVASYRQYYIGAKARFAKWRLEVPHWWPSEGDK